jgi:hypothetical protein
VFNLKAQKMSQISQLDNQITAALGRLRSSIAAGDAAAAAQPDEGELLERIAKLENENSELIGELGQLQVKRDKDVAALDELIAQLKPLIEEV